MAFPKTQNPLDWLTQLWNILCGTKADADNDAWLLGPMGKAGCIEDRFIEELARTENLLIVRNEPSSGLLEDFSGYAFPEEKLQPRICQFYTQTLNFSFDVWTQWRPIFGTFGYLVNYLFSRRIKQLNLPEKSLDTAKGMISEIISLKNQAGETVYRVWYRRLKKTGRVVYSGIYGHCILPNGEKYLKIVFPLPEGSATVVLRPTIDEQGNLRLESKGTKAGDAGFYFLVSDRKGQVWKRYLRSFHEHLYVYVDDEDCLRADHSMSVWGCKAYELHYKINPLPVR